MAERKGAIGRLAIAAASLGAFAIGNWDLFNTIPEAQDNILQNIPVCAELDMPYHQIMTAAQRALRSAQTLEELSRQPMVSRQIDCYKIAEVAFAINNVGDVGLRWSLSFGLLAGGAIGMMVLSLEAIKAGFRNLRGGRFNSQ